MGHNSREGFFLGHDCSWTLLPGSIWLQMLTTWLWSVVDCLRSFRAHFDSLQHADDLQVYQGFMMPLNQQESMQGTLKQCLLVDRPLMHYIILFSVRWYLLWCSISSCVVFHVTKTYATNLFADFCSICYFFYWTLGFCVAYTKCKATLWYHLI